jgi:membrane-associated protease RseP (regulator of RpoE activity)
MFKPLAYFLIVATTFGVVTGQTPDAKKDDTAKTPTTSSGKLSDPMRSMPLSGGVNMVFLIRELAKDLDLNVLFDAESRLEARWVRVELKNVTAAEALNYILLQEGLYFEEVGPRTILVAHQLRGKGIPQIGVVLTPLTEQLNYYFGTEGGTLINHVYADSPAAKAGLKAGDVIIEIDGVPVRGGMGLFNAVKDKNGDDFTLKIVRDRKTHAISVTPQKVIQ